MANFDLVPITTDRLVLVPASASLGSAYYDVVLANQGALAPWIPWAAPSVLAPRDAFVAGIAEREEKFRSGQDFTFLMHLNGEIIGGCGIHRMEWSVPRGEIGYWLASVHQGNGYVAEAVRALETHAFDTLGFHRLELRLDALNPRSRAVAIRGEYKHEATLHHFARNAFNDALIDLEIWTKFSPQEERS